MKNRGDNCYGIFYVVLFLIFAGNLPVCAADNAQLISVAIQPGTTIQPRTEFTQTWTFKNTGTTTWQPTQHYHTLNIMGNDCLGAIPLYTNTVSTHYHPNAIINGGTNVPPGGIASFSMNFIAPETPGTWTDTFQLNNPSSAFFGPIVSVTINVPKTGSTNQYDRSKVISYANNYVAYVCSDGYFWTNGSIAVNYGAGTPVPTTVVGDDCAHFTSCCVGREPHEFGGGMYVKNRAGTYGEPGAQRLIYTNLIGTGFAVEVPTMDELEPGDVIGWNWSGNPNPALIDHVTLYLGHGMLASHANSRLDVSVANYSAGAAKHYIHIIDAPGITQSRVGNKFIVSWAKNWSGTVGSGAGIGYALYSSTDLVNWAKVPPSLIKVSGKSNVLTNSITSVPTFYRLMLP